MLKTFFDDLTVYREGLLAQGFGHRKFTVLDMRALNIRVKSYAGHGPSYTPF